MIPRLSTQAHRLENWMGKEQVEECSRQMRDWYGPPIPLKNVPGAVYARGGGDFVGPIRGGGVGCLADYYADKVVRAWKKQARTQRLYTGFSSLSDLISEATTGAKQQNFFFYKTSTVNITASNESLWLIAGGMPGAGAAPSALAGGSVPDNTTVGGLQQVDPGGSDTLHLTTVTSQSTVAGRMLVLYDRIFNASGLPHNTTAATACSGVPTRYTTTTGDVAGNFAFLEVTNALGSTAHTVTMRYNDQAGGADENAIATTVVVSSAANRIPHAAFFIPLAAADTGLCAHDLFTMSAVSSGTSNCVIGHPLCFIPQPVANAGVIIDGINSAFNLVQIKTDACLAFLRFSATNAVETFMGSVTLVSG